jgi:TP901 family phage tail tape measure protein
VVALASAFVRLRPQADQAEFKREGQKAGQTAGDAAGKSYGDGFYRGADGKLRTANGKFATDAQRAAAGAGSGSGKAFGDGFYRDASGKLRQANGRFATDAQKAALGMGSGSGKQYASGFGKQLGGIKGQLKDAFAGAAGLFVPLGLAAAVGEIGKIGIAYEDNLNILKAVTGATGDQMDIVAQKARELGAATDLPGVSAAGAAEAMTELAKAGFTVQQSMDAAKGTLQLARVANMSEADAATIAANAVNAFGLAAKDTGFVVDELAAAANSSSLEISDASMSFKMAAAVYSSFQGSAVGSKEAITELNTAIAILGNNGIKGSDAGTSLKQMLLQLTGPTDQAKAQMALLAQRAAGATISLEQQNAVLHGSKKVRHEALEAIAKQNKGMKLEGDIAYDAAGRMRPLRDIIGLVTAGTKGMTQEERDYAVTQIFGADASRSVIALMKGGLPVYDKMRASIMQQGAAADFAAAKNAGLKGALDNVQSQVENAAISVYNAVRGPLTSGLNALASELPSAFAAVANFFGFLADHKTTILGTAYAVGILTLAVRAQAAANTVLAAGGVIKFLMAYASASKLAAAGQAILNVAMDANPIGLIIIAIGALVAAFVLLWKNSETFRTIVMGALNGIQIAAAAVAAWFTGTFLPAVQAVWNGIATGASWLWNNILKPVFNAMTAVLQGVVIPVVMFLYNGVFKPVFGFISMVVSAWWATTKAVLGAFVAFIQTFLIPIIQFLYANIFRPIFSAIGKIVEVAWYVIRIALAAFAGYLRVVIFPVIMFLWKNVVQPIFGLIGRTIQSWWNNIVRPVFAAFSVLFQRAGQAIQNVWAYAIKPTFSAISGFISKYVLPGFRLGVKGITEAWDKVKEAARKPVAFVVNKVMNPLIGGLNAVGKAVGLKDKISPIAGFASGGQIPGAPAPGGRDNRIASITGTGKAISVASGEFITNVRSTLANMGLIRAINSKRGKVTHDDVDPYLDGYSRGGPVGDGIGDLFTRLKNGAKGIGDFITDPKKALQKIAGAALDKVPGAGFVRDTVIAGGRRLINGAAAFIQNHLGLGGGIGGQSVLGGWKGMRALISQRFPGLGMISGPRPGAMTLTGNRSYHSMGRAVDYPAYRPLAQWIKGTYGARTKELITPWQDLNLHNGKPHTYTGAVWNQHNFAGGNAHVHWAAALGGLISKMSGVKVFDSGGAWAPGTIGVNTSGRTEYVDPNREGTSLGDLLDALEAILAKLGTLGVDVATGLKSNTSRAGVIARGRPAPGGA